MEIEGSTITLLTTDRYRAAVRELTWDPESSTMSTTSLVSARTLADAAKSLTSGAEVAIALASGGTGEGLLGFEGGGSGVGEPGARRTTTRLLDGQFPKVRSLFPTDAPIHARVDTAAFIESLKRVALVAERNTPVRLTFDDNTLVLEAGASDEAQASEAIDAQTQGEAISIAFNPGYLLDGLNSLATSVAVLSFTQATKPAAITGAADMEAEPDSAYKYLLMPIRLSG
jgi:DNA polymerase-3 subunit beta